MQRRKKTRRPQPTPAMEAHKREYLAAGQTTWRPSEVIPDFQWPASKWVEKVKGLLWARGLYTFHDEETSAAFLPTVLAKLPVEMPQCAHAETLQDVFDFLSDIDNEYPDPVTLFDETKPIRKSLNLHGYS